MRRDSPSRMVYEILRRNFAPLIEILFENGVHKMSWFDRYRTRFLL